MEELSFNFNSPNNRGSSLFKFASFKHSNSKEKLESGGGLIPLEYIVEQLDDEIAQIPVAPRLLPSTSTNASGEKKALPKRQAKKKKREDFSDEEDDEVDEEEPVDEEDDDRRSTRGKQHVDITEYLCLPQSDAAVKLGLPGMRKQKHRDVFKECVFFFGVVSTLSKRWKESAKTRKWPFRKVAKLDKEIAAVLTAVPQAGVDAGVLPVEIEEQLTSMLKERAFDLRKISIRL